MNTLQKLQSYAGNRKALFPVSIVLSALAALTGLLPYVIVWLIVRELFEAGGAIAGHGSACPSAIQTRQTEMTGKTVAGLFTYR
jgi:hypothetical protein